MTENVEAALSSKSPGTSLVLTACNATQIKADSLLPSPLVERPTGRLG